MEIFSRELYYCLDHLGYNHDMLQFRRESWKYLFNLNTTRLYQGKIRTITAGSKGEGITSIYESDVDLMGLDNTVLCLPTTEQVPSQLPADMIVLIADMENAPPGYTRLKLHQPTSYRNLKDNYVRESLFELQGELYLSSALYTSMMKNTVEFPSGTTSDISGPALASSDGRQCLSGDNVIAFTFHCPQLLQAWASRPRHHEWPSADIIRTACSFLPQVVPVGAKGSDRHYQEWRFCFIESELTLTHSLNGTQIKLYILLKMIAKNILKPVTGEISSYIMKNITYWMSELLPLRVFREENLVSLVLLALGFLRTSISEWQNLPYYMIPSRNLLSERLDDNTRSEVSVVLHGLIQEGPRLFLRVEKLRRCMETACLSPVDIVKFGNLRDQIERRYMAFLVLVVLKKFDVVPADFNGTNLELSISTLVLQVSSLDSTRYGMFAGDDFFKTFLRVLS